MAGCARIVMRKKRITAVMVGLYVAIVIAPFRYKLELYLQTDLQCSTGVAFILGTPLV